MLVEPTIILNGDNVDFLFVEMRDSALTGGAPSGVQHKLSKLLDNPVGTRNLGRSIVGELNLSRVLEYS